MADPKEKFSEKETAARMERALRKLLNTQPKPRVGTMAAKKKSKGKPG